jgi:hypothetical protein
MSGAQAGDHDQIPVPCRTHSLSAVLPHRTSIAALHHAHPPPPAAVLPRRRRPAPTGTGQRSWDLQLPTFFFFSSFSFSLTLFPLRRADLLLETETPFSSSILLFFGTLTSGGHRGTAVRRNKRRDDNPLFPTLDPSSTTTTKTTKDTRPPSYTSSFPDDQLSAVGFVLRTPYIDSEPLATTASSRRRLRSLFFFTPAISDLDPKAHPRTAGQQQASKGDVAANRSNPPLHDALPAHTIPSFPTPKTTDLRQAFA